MNKYEFHFINGDVEFMETDDFVYVSDMFKRGQQTFKTPHNEITINMQNVNKVVLVK
ncbi:hypothetical protein [Sporosarcina sp. FSL W7-1283]|uniref:hypothetical protein n=1 Tax=Sporosarcina sp. FSL W7-1283 TaxID=2921560 RepID=UPI0030F8978E